MTRSRLSHLVAALILCCIALLGPEGRARVLAAERATLALDGRPAMFTGINVPAAGTYTAVNGGCGAEVDVQAIFDRLPDRTVVRVFFGQDLTLNAATGARDWRALDRVVRAAEASPARPLLIIGLTNQWGICDGGIFKDHAWFEHGYRDARPAGPNEAGRVPYRSFLGEVLSRYGRSPSVIMWEPAGEAEASTCGTGRSGDVCDSAQLTCPADASLVLGRFFNDVAALVRRLSPGKLVASGAIGGTQCGWAGPAGQTLMASRAFDVLTVHDYRQNPGLDTTGLDTMRYAEQIGKPVLLEEIGLTARDGGNCQSEAERADALRAKLDAAEAVGIDGWLLWAFGEGSTACDLYIGFNDPSFDLLRGPQPR